MIMLKKNEILTFPQLKKRAEKIKSKTALSAGFLSQR